MARFLVDEDLPRSLLRELRDGGFDSRDVREVGLQGKTDDEVLAWAVSQGFALLTGDVGFGNLLRFRLGSHAGIVIARFPTEFAVGALNRAILESLSGLSPQEIDGNLVIIEPGRIRVRRKS